MQKIQHARISLNNTTPRQDRVIFGGGAFCLCFLCSIFNLKLFFVPLNGI